MYLYNPENGAPIKKWYDGSSFWKLDVGEVASFPEAVGERLKRVYGFLRELSSEEYEVRLAKLEETKLAKIKVGEDGALVPKSDEELKAEESKIETEKEEVKKISKKIKEAKEAKPVTPQYWELTRGELINEVNKRGLDVKGLNTKGVYVTKDQLVNYLESDDQK